MTTRVKLVAAGLVLVVGACREPLTAINPNNPDVERVFRQPASIEQTLATGYQQCRNTEKGTDMTAQMATMSLESYSQLGNFNMGLRGAIPRSPILNNKSAQQSLNGNFGAWSRQGRLQANALKQLDALRAANSPVLASEARDLKARAQGFFNIGCNLGWLAMAFDSAGIIDHIMASDFVPELSGYTDVMNAALAMMDSALAMASPASEAGFPILLSATSLSRADFVKLVRSYKARFRAGVARTPAERAAVNWAEVAADADAGLTADLVVTIGATSGWTIGVQTSTFYQDAAWSQITPFIFGFADQSGGYDTWLSTPITQRNGAFLIVTPDLRFPQGSTRPAQIAASPEPGNHTGFPYMKNRSGPDSPGDPWGTSYYEHHRLKYIRNNSSTGPYPEFLKSEVDLLGAEAYLRLGDMTKALSRINTWRTRAGLPAISGASMNDVIAGPNCVPRVPAAPNYTTTACGTIFEAMKWEKRMEQAYNYMGAWFFDARGWGDLVQDTPLHYPVPVPELDARLKGYYNLGGGGDASAALGTYRW